jgi:hypothetical protein
METMSNDTAARIAELEREVGSLRDQLAKYRPAPIVLKPDGAFVLPSEEHCGKLISRVFERHPNLRADIDRGDISAEQFTRMVRGALLYIGSLQRMRGAVHRQRDYLDWLYACDDHLTLIGKSGTTRGSSFFTACICAGDVCYTPPRLWPTTRDVGLIIGYRTNSYSATNAWMRVATGDFNASLIVEPPPATLHSPRQPYEMAGHVNWRQELARG